MPQTNAGDLKMVTEWWRLSVVVKQSDRPTSSPARWASDSDNPPYISVERTKRSETKKEENHE